MLEDIRQKKIYYRAHHRGIKEMDIVLGGFVSHYLVNMSSQEMDALENIMEVPDQVLYKALLAKDPKGLTVDQAMFDRMSDYLHKMKRK